MTVDRRAAGSFLLWALCGLLLALGIAALPSVGTFVLPIGVLLSLVVGWMSQGRGAAGLLFGAGMAGLFIAYLHRPGPGWVCTVTPVGRTCGEYLDPVPYLVAGLALSLLALALEWVAHRRRGRAAANHRRDEVTRPG